MSVLNNSNAIESGGYNIDRSLRFRSSASAYLNRTLGTATNSKICTISDWVKRGRLGYANPRLLDANNGGASKNSNFNYYFNGSDKLEIGDYNDVILTSSQVFRDPSAWYHIVVAIDTTQATAANRIKVYVNGSQVTYTTGASFPSQNEQLTVNTACAHGIAAKAAGGDYFDGYLAEVNFIDGQALTPSSFGATDAITGVWQPKKYTGTYGTNGFYLPFSDNTSATTLAYDKSGNGNNWTANNISTTAGATYDSMTDVPTLTSATAANYAVWNPLDRTAATYSEGNLKVVSTSNAAPYNMTATIAIPMTGKFYWEITAIVGANSPLLGIGTNRPTDLISGYRTNGTYINNIAGASTSGTPSTYTTNDIIGIAYDVDAGTLSFYKNGVAQTGGISSIPAGQYLPCVRADSASGDGGYANFGQRPFSYTPPTGFKALNTFNLPDPTIKKPNQYMDVNLWAGTGATNVITNAAGFQPDLVWAKVRTNAYNHALFDSVRGANKVIASNATDAEVTQTQGLMSFNSNGFTLGTSADSTVNNAGSGQTYVGWQWKESATAGFDIVTYTGTGSARTISHSLGVAPKLIIVKRRDTATNWPVYDAVDGYTKVMYLNLTNQSTADGGATWNAAPTSSVFSVGTSVDSNGSGGTFVAYLFAEIPGFSKFGSYTGNGSTDGPFVYCGFRPKFILLKRSSGTENWQIYDGVRSAYNVNDNQLYPNTSAAEGTGGSYLDLVSNGFKLRNAAAGGNATADYIYAAFAENPMKYSLAR